MAVPLNNESGDLGRFRRRYIRQLAIQKEGIHTVWTPTVLFVITIR